MNLGSYGSANLLQCLHLTNKVDIFAFELTNKKVASSQIVYLPFYLPFNV